MAENSTISWCDHTFNPWVGCTKVSPACDHCYAEGWAKRTGQAGLWNGERRRTSTANWRQPYKWNNATPLDQRRPRVFCASLADVFDNQAEPEWRADLFAMIRETPNLDWLLLTKRPQNIARMLPMNWGTGWPNVWLGATVENQLEAARRIPFLINTPAAIRFLSCEPLLGALDLSGFMPAVHHHPDNRERNSPAMQSLIKVAWDRVGGGIDWVIAGGESGGGARPMHPDWVRSLRDQCATAGVAFHLKQWGEFAPGEIAGEYLDPEKAAKGVSLFDGRWNECWSEPDGHRDDEPDLYRVGKKRAGRMLDGVQHDGFPA